MAPDLLPRPAGGVREVYGAKFTGTQVWTARLRECDPRGSRIFWVGGVVVRILVILADVFLLERHRRSATAASAITISLSFV